MILATCGEDGEAREAAPVGGSGYFTLYLHKIAVVRVTEPVTVTETVTEPVTVTVTVKVGGTG